MNELGILCHAHPEDLVPHAANVSLYGDEVDQEFIDSCKGGIIEPIVTTTDMTIISGHRRRKAAISHGWETVPVLIRHDLLDPLDIEEFLILANRQREKTNEQKAREFKRLKEIETERAKQTSPGGRGKKTPDQSGTEFSRRSDVKAAEVAGLSRNTALKATKVVEAIDAAEESGETEKADQLREDLNKSVSGAHKKISTKKVKANVPKHLEETFEMAAMFTGLIQRVGNIRKDVFDLASGKGGERLPVQQLRIDLNNVSEALQCAVPHAVCPYCKGVGCEQCDDLGWMHRDRYAGIPEERR